ncbi:Patatin-like protein 6 [Raphanus sativus]|uniref:Patatin n=1 Tax=Raphanus sativus TaxID=3726 RepID=A0A6J0MUS8_RAPSA|nr:patatin-like protein 6 [Raphanus sativus]KAJ4906804.1 Patatin-like protein 6 [Raphanus sativus]
MQRVHNKAPSATVKHHLIKQSNNGGVTAEAADMQEPSIETDKLSYEIFSILESKFLFGYDDDTKLMESRSRDPSPEQECQETSPTAANGVVPGSIKNQRGKVCVLSIDGGGMRGIIPGKALSYLEQALKLKSGDPNARIADYFDVASGSGIGGIFTAMLFASNDGDRPIFKADDTWRFLAKNGKSFYKSQPGKILNRVMKTGAGSKLEKSMKESFAELTLKDTLKPVLIPCYDLTSSAPFLFSRADALETDGYDFKLWEVCKATWAEPGVFEPVEMRSVDGKTRCVAVDGGLAMSNPTAAAITHVLHNKQEFPFVRGVEDLLVLSLGTGQLVDVKYECDKVMKWKAKQWARPAVRISADGAADTVDQAVSMAFGQCRRSNYVRIQADGSSFGPCKPNIDTDASPSNVNMLVGVAEEMLKQKNVESVLFGGKKINQESNFEKLDWLAGELVLEHQRRSCRIAPTVAFKQSSDRRTDDQKTIFKDIDCMF